MKRVILSLAALAFCGAAQAQSPVLGVVQTVDSTVASLHATGAGLAAGNALTASLYQTAAGPLRFGLPLGNQLVELGSGPGYLGLVENIAGGGLGSITGLTQLDLLEVLPVTGTLPPLPGLTALPTGVDLPGLADLATGAVPRLGAGVLPGL